VEVKPLVAQGRFDEAESEIRSSGISEQEKSRLLAEVNTGRGEDSMRNGDYVSAIGYFGEALNKDPANQGALRGDCLAIYKFLANRSFRPDSPRPNPAAIKVAVDACEHTSYGPQVLPFIRSNLNSQPKAAK
ncbi:MAG TPA: hypothetical protein VJ718_08830, partial [Candidatus Binataceae bacterium]|nr:hypothetical protein [Candidatus Binataceae bacterium]